LAISLEAEMFRNLALGSAAVVAGEARVAQDDADQNEVVAEVEAPAPEPAREEVAAVAPNQEPATAATTEQAPTFEVIGEQLAEEPASATFASHVPPEELDTPISARATDESVHTQTDSDSAEFDSNHEDMGDQEAMAKDAKAGHGKGSKSGWHQIRAAAAPAANADIVEAAKHPEAEPQTEEHPKALAAAAASDDSTSAPLADQNAIASIVDSVLADLRPRIVEEIAKKLAKK
jgi:hypothetical protein